MRRVLHLHTAFLIPILVWMLIGLGALLRTYHADIFPIDNNDDGLYYVWTGTSLLQSPSQVHSHTIFDSDNAALIWRSQYYDYVPHLRFGMKIVEPWFDHPPLGSLIAGFPAYLLGYDQVEQMPHMIVRYPALIASIFTLLGIYLLAQKLFGTRTALFSLLFAATTPYFVFAHRQSYLENFLTPVFLGSLISYLYYQESKRPWQLYLSLLLSFLCGWFKIPAFAIPLMLAGWSYYLKNKKLALLFLLSFIVSLSSYVAYGLLTSSDFFLNTLSNQGVRGMYLSSFIESFVKPMFYGEFMDGLYILGLLFSFVVLLKREKTSYEKFFSWFFMAWIIVLFLVSGKYNNSPWYRYPLIPFMSISIGIYADELWKKKSLFIAALFLLFGFSGYTLAGIELSSTILRISTLLVFAPFVLIFFHPKNKWLEYLSSVMVIVLLGLVIFGNILAIKQYPYEKCEKEPCLQPTKIIFDRS